MNIMSEQWLAEEYCERGEYHKHLDMNWSYYPIYIRKIAYIDEFLKNIAFEKKILDAGCGEGVLVEKYHALGRDITGLDLNVTNKHVQKGDILNMPFEEECFDIVMLLDVIEHLNVQQHPLVFNELKRVLKKTGALVLSIPNLAHKASRWHFYTKGELLRTAKINKHPGDRPIKEFIRIILEGGWLIEKRIPIKLTLPPFQEKWAKRILGKTCFEAYIYSRKRNPDDCFLNIFVLRKQTCE